MTNEESHTSSDEANVSDDSAIQAPPLLDASKELTVL